MIILFSKIFLLPPLWRCRHECMRHYARLLWSPELSWMIMISDHPYQQQYNIIFYYYMTCLGIQSVKFSLVFRNYLQYHKFCHHLPVLVEVYVRVSPHCPVIRAISFHVLPSGLQC